MCIRDSYKGNRHTGRSAYSFGTLLKLYLYGYLNSISSSRKLERETLRNMELIWLLGNLHPDHKTIADFRSQQTSGIHECCLDFRRFLVSSGYISGKLVAVDGSKIKANVNRDGLTLDGINRQLALLDTRLEKYLHQLNENDLVETAHEQLSELSDELGVESSLLEKIARLSQQVEELQAEKPVSYTHLPPLHSAVTSAPPSLSGCVATAGLLHMLPMPTRIPNLSNHVSMLSCRPSFLL